MAYKWTIPECDEVEMPMIHVLLGQIGEMPPQDFLVNAQIKAQIEAAKRKQQAALGSMPVRRGKVRRRTHGD